MKGGLQFTSTEIFGEMLFLEGIVLVIEVRVRMLVLIVFDKVE